MNIRRANIDDIDKLLDLAYPAYIMHYNARPDLFKIHKKEDVYNELEYAMKNPFSITLVVEENGIFRGYISFSCLYKVVNSLWINQLYVEEKSRKKGYGKALINEVELYARENNFERIELNCWSFNENAIDFYNRLNFKSQRIVYEKDVQNE